MLAIIDPTDLGTGAPGSQATYAYETIRGDILTGLHRPAKKLKIQDLAMELKASPGVVREALSRLVPEQLVVSWDQRGFAVAPLSVADLQDLTDLRCEIEAIALRRSVELGDIGWEATLIAAAHRLRVTPPPQPGPASAQNAGWIAAHAAFHAALVSACSTLPRIVVPGRNRAPDRGRAPADLRTRPRPRRRRAGRGRRDSHAFDDDVHRRCGAQGGGAHGLEARGEAPIVRRRARRAFVRERTVTT